MVQTRTRIMNQLQAVALNEGLRYKKRLWREAGRRQLEFLSLAAWSSRRRQDLLELLDRTNPMIANGSVWATSVNKAIRCCVSCWWKRRSQRCGAMGNGGSSSSTCRNGEDGKSPK